LLHRGIIQQRRCAQQVAGDTAAQRDLLRFVDLGIGLLHLLHGLRRFFPVDIAKIECGCGKRHPEQAQHR
jgi:hypothetical protein